MCSQTSGVDYAKSTDLKQILDPNITDAECCGACKAEPQCTVAVHAPKYGCYLKSAKSQEDQVTCDAGDCTALYPWGPLPPKGCGSPTQDCCADGCDQGLTCADGECRSPQGCGADREPCCPNGTCTFGNVACDPATKKCLACGSEGMLCCAGGAQCPAGGSCSKGYCQGADWGAQLRTERQLHLGSRS